MRTEDSLTVCVLLRVATRSARRCSTTSGLECCAQLCVDRVRAAAQKAAWMHTVPKGLITAHHRNACFNFMVSFYDVGDLPLSLDPTDPLTTLLTIQSCGPSTT